MIRGLIQSITWVAGSLRRFTGTGLPGQSIQNREMAQHYGFSSDPPAGTIHISVQTGNHLVAVAEDQPAGRPDLDALNGAACVWKDQDHYILIKKDGSVFIKTDQEVVIDSDDIRLGTETELQLKKLVHEDILTTLQALTLPVSGAVAGPPVPGTFTALLHATANVRGK